MAKAAGSSSCQRGWTKHGRRQLSTEVERALIASSILDGMTVVERLHPVASGYGVQSSGSDKIASSHGPVISRRAGGGKGRPPLTSSMRRAVSG